MVPLSRPWLIKAAIGILIIFLPNRISLLILIRSLRWDHLGEPNIRFPVGILNQDLLVEIASNFDLLPHDSCQTGQAANKLSH